MGDKANWQANYWVYKSADDEAGEEGKSVEVEDNGCKEQFSYGISC